MGSKFSMTAIILAGGRSSRMGQDKALLQFGEKTILEHLVHFATSLFKEVLIIVNQGKELGGLDLKEADVYEDLIQERGPLAGLYTGLIYSKNLSSCVFTCDMPFIDDFMVRKLVAHREVGFDVVCLEAPEGGYQPFPGIYSRSSHPLIKSVLDRGENSMRFFLELARVKSVALEKEKAGILTNMNTIQDYFRALKEKEHHVDSL